MDPVVQALREIVPHLAEAIGEEVEVVLHDLSHPQDSVVAIAGDVTSRKLGAPLTDMFQRRLLRGDTRDCMNYPTSTPDGRKLRSSTIFVRDGNGTPIACLCINLDITKWLIAKHLTASYCQAESMEGEVGETFATDVQTMLRRNIEEAIEQQKIPAAMMKKEDKLAVVRRLDKVGAFEVKGAVGSVAQGLGVSRYTIYNYLNEIREGTPGEQVIHPTRRRM